MDNEKTFETEEIIYEDDYFRYDASMSIEDVSKLNENEALTVASLVEVEIEKYENMIIKAEDNYYTEKQLIELGFNQEDYYRLKDLEKEIYKHLKKLRRKVKNEGFFGALPLWAAILGVVSVLFNIIPANPYLPILIYQSFYDKFNSEFMLGTGGAYIFYFAYLALFYLTQFVLLFVLFRLGRKDKSKRKAFYAYLVVAIITLLCAIPAIIIFVQVAKQF